ncbi:hypothetical protein FQN54_005120 [Arachnomyces sp. PD_36]|nr:hypothetical protein FQN54_005120 [Arachnomyces sp. PD_36]
MEFWSRLIGGSGSKSSKTAAQANSSGERLTSFKRSCHTLQQIWRSKNTPVGELSATLHARSCLARLNSVLSDESRAQAPHPCLSFAASSQIYVTVTKLALSSSDAEMISAAAVFFNTLIDAEVEGIIDSRAFARALVDLVKISAAAGEEGEGRLVELLFGVANNIRLQPEILHAWFAPQGNYNSENYQAAIPNGGEFAGATRKEDFPLFYLLIDYVHHDGRPGDFARTGLLYIIEAASRSKDLERWLIESDLATLMATGLGALYSQLSRKLLFSTDEENVPHIIALSDHAHLDATIQPHHGGHMDAFLSYLLFWQDTIDHCKSAEVNDTLLDHFQVLFLQQLLYPSLLESSDVDGGSTSAVITYLYRILESIDQPDMIHRILHFLLASPSAQEAKVKPPSKKARMSLSRRKSLDLLASFAEAAAKPSPSLFNLVDLILMSIRSKNRQTVVATLRLITVIVRRHHSFAGSLIKTTQGPETKGTPRTIGALNVEMQQMLGMATSIVDDPSLDQSYENYLKDASAILESRLFIMPPPGVDVMDGPVDTPLLVRQDDAILRELLTLLESFFTNSTLTNLALTDAISSLASSNLVSLDGWLLIAPRLYEYKSLIHSDGRLIPEENADSGNASSEGDPSKALGFAYEEPSWSPEDVAAVPAVLRKLIYQIERWHEDVPDFDILIRARLDLLHSEDEGRRDLSQADIQKVEPTSNPGSNRRREPSIRLGSEAGSPRGRQPRKSDRAEASPSPAALSTFTRSRLGSPLQSQSHSTGTPSSRARSTSRSAVADELRRRLAMPFKLDSAPIAESAEPGDEDESISSVAVQQNTNANSGRPREEVTLGHVLTNTVILYEFILELSALVQVRGSLFGEAGFLS